MEVYSSKLKKSGLHVAICIMTGFTMCTNGPYEPGIWNDLMIIFDLLLSHINEHEQVVADDEYHGMHPKHVKCPAGFANPVETEKMQQRVDNHQETANNKFKFWGILKEPFWHDISLHGVFLVASLQSTMVNSSSLVKTTEINLLRFR